MLIDFPTWSCMHPPRKGNDVITHPDPTDMATQISYRTVERQVLEVMARHQGIWMQTDEAAFI